MEDTSSENKTTVPDNPATYADDLWDLRPIEPGTHLQSWTSDGIRYIIMRGPVAFTVYFGVPVDHPIAGFDYDDLNVDVHGGLTFADNGDGKRWPEHYYWYGWDYGHAGDLSTYDMDEVDNLPDWKKDDKKWTLGEVRKQTEWAHYSIYRIIRLAEKIARKR